MRMKPRDLLWTVLLLLGAKWTVSIEHYCPAGWFDCGNERCIAMFFVCDKDDDCGNMADEKDCPENHNTVCQRDDFQCVDSGRCIHGTWRCDGHADCFDLSDEANCGKNITCDGFLCEDNQCIAKKWRCDKQWDCPNGEDELNCDKAARTCTEHEYTCADATCIPISKACDGRKDCSKGEDEGNHCEEKACKNISCSHECFLTPNGPKCDCRPGYQLEADGRTCVDVDECIKDPSPCTQHCINTKGSFSCSCKAGYTLHDNGECMVEGQSPLLLMATSHEIRGYWIRTARFFRVASTTRNALGVSYDSLESKVYWVETRNRGGAIMVADLDGTDKELVLTKGLQDPQDVVVDFIARNLYISDEKLQQVLVCKIDGSICTAIMNSEKPRGLTIDHRNRKLYVSDWGESKPGIYRASLDGSRKVPFVNVDIFWPNGLTIDFTSDRLYWCDAKLKRIEYVGLSSGERKLVLQDTLIQPYYISVFEDTMYYSDWNKYSLEACNKRTGKNQTTLQRGKRTAGVHVYHPIEYINERNPCWDGRCSHLCLIADKGFTCACPAGYELDFDKITCIPSRNASFLLAAEESALFHIHPESVGENIVTQFPLRSVMSIGDMAFDWSTLTLFISDLHKRVIFSMNTTTFAVTPLVSNRLDTVEGIDYDFIGNNLYWVDAGTGSVEAVTRDGKTRVTLVDGLLRPMDIAVCPEKGVMFLVQSGDVPKIIRCNMDGKNCETLVDTNLGTPVAISLNIWESRLMWVDPKQGLIESTNFDGQGRVKNFQRKGAVMSVAYTPDYIFWTDLSNHLVHYARTQDASIQGEIKLPHEHNGDLVLKIAYFSPPPSQRGSVCSVRNGACSHMCLTDPLGYTCACNSSSELGLDAHTCQKKVAKPGSSGCIVGEFPCASGECIQSEFVCNGANDCEDGSDESKATCVKTCPSGDFKCDNGHCIISKWRCDGQDDCGDKSDEAACPTPPTCKSDEFVCPSGKCLPLLWVCDGDNDCDDNADEGPHCRNLTCMTQETRCDDGKCVPSLWFCDGEPDCNDGSDELESKCGKAQKTCDSNEFTCGNGYCLDRTMVCDRRIDCPDGADEQDCPVSGCKTDEYMCPENLCINNKSVCDGFEDCRNGQDEKDCDTPILECKSFEFHCKTGKCIMKQSVCDGVDDCGDNEDEAQPKCNKVVSEKPIPSVKECPEFRCVSGGNCLPWTRVCDGNPDCYDSSDEGRRCGARCSHDNGGCTHKCRDTPMGVVCSCREGYTLMPDEKTCEDKDECLTPGQCSQSCANTKGSFKCTCVEGYTMSADGRRCKALGEPETLLVQTFERIRELSLDGNQHLVEGTHTDIRGLDFDAESNTIFWTEMAHGVINSLTDKKTYGLIAKNLQTPTYLAYDWIGRNLYFTTNKGSIDVCRRDGSVCGLVLDIEHTAHSFAMDPTQGIMFWSVWSDLSRRENGVIERANMDGTDRVTIVANKITWPTALTVDIVMSRIYWSDVRLNTIEVADMDGYNREIIVKTGAEYPYSMTLFEDHLYWSNWGTKKIVRCNKFNGGNRFPLKWDDLQAYGLKMAHKVLQPKAQDSCSKAKCEQLCLVKYNGYKCACGYDFNLANDSVSCVPKGMPTSSTKLFECPKNYCFNGGMCSVEENEFVCGCPIAFHGVRCEYIVKSAQVEEQDLTWVAGVVLGVLLVALVLIGMGLLWRRHGQRIRGVINERVTVSFKNPGFRRNAGGLNVEQASSQDGQSGEEILMGKDGAYKGGSTKKLNEEGGMYRWPSNESVNDSAFVDKDDQGLLSGSKSSSQPDKFRRFFQRN